MRTDAATPPTSAPDGTPPSGGADVPGGDRAITPVNGRLGAGKGKAVVLAALIVGSGTLLGLAWEGERVDETSPSDPARQIVDFEPSAPRVSRPTLIQPGPNPPILTDQPDLLVPAIETTTDQSTANEPRSQAHRSNAAPGPLLIYSRQATARATAQPNRPAAGFDDPTDVARATGGPTVSVLRAERLPDRNFLVLAGTNLPCVLMTALDSTIAGLVSCVTPRDVLSDNGNTVLLDKGTRVLGEHRSSMRQGERRISVLWTRAVTPGGVVISLDSLGADALGRAGFDGDVDSRFWARFGGALALSLIDDGAYAAFGSTSETARVPSDAAAVALEANLDIAAVLRKNQGDEVSIFVAHDLDFSNVYGLRSR